MEYIPYGIDCVLINLWTAILLELRAPRFSACLSVMKLLGKWIGWTGQDTTDLPGETPHHVQIDGRAVGPRGKLQSGLGPLYREGAPAVRWGAGVSI